MFERFTERARKVVVLAQDEARHFGHNYIGTEHLLLGLMREEDGVAVQALAALGVTLERMREQVEAIVGYGEGIPAQAPFTRRSKKVLEFSLKEAINTGHDYIGTEHLLLGLLREPEGVAAVMMSNLGVDPDALRQEVSWRLGGARGGGLGSLGWTREALSRSFGRYPQSEDRGSFEKFTEQARRVVVIAQEEARDFHHDYIGTEHLLLGLLRGEDRIASKVLTSLGAHPDGAREQLESIVGRGEGTGAQAPFTPRAQRVFQFAIHESFELGHYYVGPEHVLLGLVGEGEGVAVRILANLGVDLDDARREVLRLADGGRQEGHEANLGEGPFRTRISGIEVLVRCGKNTRERSERRPANVDLDVLHEAPRSVEVDAFVDGLRGFLEPTGFTLPESLVDRIGEYAMDALPEAEQVRVDATLHPAKEKTPRVSVSRTFKRW